MFSRVLSYWLLFAAVVSPVVQCILVEIMHGVHCFFKNALHVVVNLACDRWSVVCHSGAAWI